MSAPERTKALCVPTPYTSVAQLVRALYPFADETTIFIATPVERAVGVESPFAILLADRTPALRGSCIVVDAYPDDASSPHGRRGLRIALYGLTPASRHVFDLVQQARAPRPPPLTQRAITIKIPAIVAPAPRRQTAAPPPPPPSPTTELPVQVIPPRPPAALADGSQPMSLPPPPTRPTAELDAGWDSNGNTAPPPTIAPRITR